MKLITKFLFVVFLCLSGPIIFADDSKTSDQSVYTESHLSITVTADRPAFTIKLKSNPTTGYSWFLREYNDSYLSLVNHHFESPQTKLMGAPGVDVWTFKVKPAGFTKPHQVKLRMVYMRPWESADHAPQVVFNIKTVLK